jgi:hydrogenase/urease accessory protein HupE
MELFNKLSLCIITALLLFITAPASAHNMPLGGSQWCFGKETITASLELNSLLFSDIQGIKEGHYNPDTSSDEELRHIASSVIQPYLDKKLLITINGKSYPVKVTGLSRNDNNLFKIRMMVDNISFNNPANPVKIDYQVLFEETDNAHVNLAYMYLTDAVGDDLQKILDFSQPDGQFSFERDSRAWEISIKGRAAGAASNGIREGENSSAERKDAASEPVPVNNNALQPPDDGTKRLFAPRKQPYAGPPVGAFSLISSHGHEQDNIVSDELPKQSVWTNIGKFIALGIEHILTGYDHIAFLLALIVIGLSIREVLKIITAFTLAHSITLLLAAMQVVSLNSRVVESVIAFSICYVALENLLKKEVNYRWLLTFGFGLIHGFGFASVLQELIVGKSKLLVSVVSFNLGVEIGQLMIFLVLLPVLHLLKNTIEFRKVTIGTSLAILLLGFTWLIQRVFNLQLLPI